MPQPTTDDRRRPSVARRLAFPWPVLCQLPQRFRPVTSSIEETCQIVEQESLLFWVMPNQRIYRPGTLMTFTPEEAFEMEVYAAMDDFRIDYSLARCAVAEWEVVMAIVNFGARCRGLRAIGAEKAVVTAIVNFGAWCRGLRNDEALSAELHPSTRLRVPTC